MLTDCPRSRWLQEQGDHLNIYILISFVRSSEGGRKDIHTLPPQLLVMLVKLDPSSPRQFYLCDIIL